VTDVLIHIIVFDVVGNQGIKSALRAPNPQKRVSECQLIDISNSMQAFQDLLGIS
jgi:hypothetical protein